METEISNIFTLIKFISVKNPGGHFTQKISDQESFKLYLIWIKRCIGKRKAVLQFSLLFMF